MPMRNGVKEGHGNQPFLQGPRTGRSLDLLGGERWGRFHDRNRGRFDARSQKSDVRAVDALASKNFGALQRGGSLFIGDEDAQLFLGGEAATFSGRPDLVTCGLVGMGLHRGLPLPRPPYSISFLGLVSLYVDTEGFTKCWFQFGK